ncbi:MAG: DnaJ domain-containing protein [Acidimicrobiia bacterium]
MILAELTVHHTRRHMPTRRVALGDQYLPMTGSAHGAGLLAAVVAEHASALDEEQRDELPRLLHDIGKHGIAVPRIALRHRLQTDRHGLDRSRHRLLDEGGRLVVELDVHGAPVPQVLGAILAAGSMGSSVWRRAIRAIEAAANQPGMVPEPFVVRRLIAGIPILTPPRAGMGPVETAFSEVDGGRWVGIPAERRWAMEVFGITADMLVERKDVQRRFRRLLRLAHPDHGGEADDAAERIAELTEAWELLLDETAREA